MHLRPTVATALLAGGLMVAVVLPTAHQVPSAGAATTTKKPDATNGKKLYLASCATCHGKDGKGLPKLGKNLVTSVFTRKLKDPDLVKFIKVGRSASDKANTTGVAMPPKGGNPALTDANIADIVAYVRSLQKKKK